MTIKIEHDVLFSNFTYDPNIYYFFYCGDIKAYYLNHFIKDVLRSKSDGKEVQFVAIVPDFLAQYDYQNIIVINPVISEYLTSSGNNGNSDSSNICCRIKSTEFMTAVSGSATIRELIDLLLQNQKNLFLYLFESMEEMTLDEIERVTILGPDKSLAKLTNDKIWQYKQVSGLVPTAEHCFCEEPDALLEITGTLRKSWSDGIFISCAYSAAGANSLVSYSQEDLALWCVEKKGPFLISRYIPHTLDPTVLGVVANEEDIYIAGIADQLIKNGNRFIGSTYPSMASNQQKKTLYQHTILIGKMLGKLGYRGIFGCDYIVANDGDIYFIEINARKQGTTLEFCYTLEQSLPAGSPILPELEYYAVTENRLPDNCIELKSTDSFMYWGTYNYKVSSTKNTVGYIPHNPFERRTFRKVAQGKLNHDFVVLEHVGSDFTVLPGTFLARVVSVAASREKMKSGLRQGVGFIKQTINEA